MAAVSRIPQTRESKFTDVNYHGGRLSSSLQSCSNMESSSIWPPNPAPYDEYHSHPVLSLQSTSTCLRPQPAARLSPAFAVTSDWVVLPHPLHNLAHSFRPSSSPWSLPNLTSCRQPWHSGQLPMETSLWPDSQIHMLNQVLATH